MFVLDVILDPEGLGSLESPLLLILNVLLLNLFYYDLMLNISLAGLQKVYSLLKLIVFTNTALEHLA